MSLHRFRKLGAGDTFTAEEMNKLADAARGSQLGSATGGVSVGTGGRGIELVDYRNEPIWARITGGTNPYSWVQVDETDTPTLSDLAGGLTGSTTQGEAYEISGSATVASGTKVQLYFSPTQDQLLFMAPTPSPLCYFVTNTPTATGSATAWHRDRNH